MNQTTWKNIIKARQNLADGFDSWEQVKQVEGVGEVTMQDLITFCLDPAKTPISGIPVPPGDDLESEVNEKSASASTDGVPTLVVGVKFPLQHNMGLTLEGIRSQQWCKTFLAAGSEQKPGLMMGDS